MERAYRPLFSQRNRVRGDLQRLDAPRTPPQIALQAAAVLVWLGLIVGITFANKAVMSTYEFTFPVALTALHLGTTWAVAAAVLHVALPLYYRARRVPPEARAHRVQPLPPGGEWRYVLFGALVAANVGIANAALRYASVSLREVVASTTPAVVLVGERAVLRTRHSAATYAVLAPTVLGAVLVSASALGGAGTGAAASFAGVLLSSMVPLVAAAKSVVSKRLMVTGDRLDPLNLMYRMTLPAALLLLPVAAVTDYDGLEAWLQSDAVGRRSAAVVLGSAALAVAVNFFNLVAVRVTSPLTLQVASNFKHALTIGVALWLLEAAPGALAVAGVALTLAGCAGYTAVRWRAVRSAHETA